MSVGAVNIININGEENRGVRDDERLSTNSSRTINICRVYIAPPPAPESNELFCRICHDTKSESTVPLISPCRCTGSSGFVHQHCIENWLTLSGTETCDLCNYRFNVYRTMKPLREWVKTPLEVEDIFVVIVTCFAYVSLIINIVAVVFQCIRVSREPDTFATFNLTALIISSFWALMNVIFLTLGTWSSPNWEDWRENNTRTRLSQLVYVDGFNRDSL